jgi:hypothetical protein
VVTAFGGWETKSGGRVGERTSARWLVEWKSAVVVPVEERVRSLEAERA